MKSKPLLSTHERYFRKAKRFLARSVVQSTVQMISKESIPVETSEIRLFSVIRNESLRLPYFLDYYRKLGVDRFFFLDNDSTDDTRELLSTSPETHLFSCKKHFKNKAYWLDTLLRNYGKGHWCVVIDADEFLILPPPFEYNLKDYCHSLEQTPANALRCLLLDMYPKEPLSTRHYETGTNPLLQASFFDPGPYPLKQLWLSDDSLLRNNFNPLSFYGGMRERVFGLKAICLSKVPLFFYHSKMFLTRGAHFLDEAKFSSDQGALLHFKYLADFPLKVREAIERQQYDDHSMEYRFYAKKLDQNETLSLFDRKVSIRYQNPQQLLRLGILKKTLAEPIKIHAHSRETKNKSPVQGLWIGNKLSRLEELSILSFLKNGHPFHLYLYEPLDTPAPAGTQIMDAREIIPQQDVFSYDGAWPGAGSYAGFSDLFRFKLLSLKGGWYVDLDVTCLKAFDFPGDYFFRGNHLTGAVGNVLKCPQGSPFAKEVFETLKKKLDKNNTNWHLPNNLLWQLIQEHALSSFIFDDLAPDDRFGTVQKLVLEPPALDKDWHFIHWCQEHWRRQGWDKNEPKHGSLYEELLRRYEEVPPSFVSSNKR